MGLEAPCTTTKASGDRLYVLGKRSVGDVYSASSASGERLFRSSRNFGFSNRRFL
jgi:hypothetical protein